MGIVAGDKVLKKKRILARFEFLYGKDRAEQCLKRLQQLFASYGFQLYANVNKDINWDESDAILIAYGDVVQDTNRPEKPRLQLLESFLDDYLKDVVSTVHILPFFPSSSDAGFSVIDYRKVRDDLGNWDDIERLAGKYKLMFDLVINHASRFSQWFENYETGKSPGKDYFIEVDPALDFSAVTRPRNSPLLTTVQTNNGLRHVWTTFSDDQIDLNFSNPDVLFEFIDIFLFYYTRGARVFRFDAVAYLWKRIGTSSIHLSETHQVVKLFRDLAECIDPQITLITETNVPFNENINYFGTEDEAHMIYQFSLPPLLLHAIITENATYLTEWASELPDLPAGCTYLNFTASHDGIGVRPLEGLIPDDEFDYLLERTKERGGFVSYKSNSTGGKNPYELNITYFDAFEQPGHPRTDIQIKRYLCSQIIMLSLQGVPGIYFHNLTATKNNMEGVAASGSKRDINRKHWEWDALLNCVDDSKDAGRNIFSRYKTLLKKRSAHPAFHPSAEQTILKIDERLFTFTRTAPDENEKILIINNISGKKIEIKTSVFDTITIPTNGVTDLLSEKLIFKKGLLHLAPFQSVWLQLNKDN